MLAAILCLPVLLMLTSACLARPLRRVAVVPFCPSGQPSMPDLNGLTLRSSPRVLAAGRLIKGLYYSERSGGPHALTAFYMACDQVLEPKPFLVQDFRSNQFSFDGNRDGCAEATEAPAVEIDPADFYPALDGYETLCDEDIISQR
jgi:hypothetical protein